ncbi:MAG: hypothetical protein R3C16_00155 [Hyphomonadaceae bacterium]
MGRGHARVEFFTFIDVEGFRLGLSIRIDTLSAIMLVVVNTVSFLVHLIPGVTWPKTAHRARFFSYLSFFTSRCWRW